MKRILVLLVTIISISGYSQDVNVYEIDRKSFTNQNFYQIKDLINFFIDDLDKFSTVYHDVNDVDESTFKLFINKIRNSEIISDFDLNQNGVLGVSKSIYDDTKITVSINPNEWINSSDEKKLYVLYHELGHDILNFKHGEGGKMMFSLSEEDYSLYDFCNDRDEMFNYFLKNYLIESGQNKVFKNIFNLNFHVSLMDGYSIKGKKITGYFKWFGENGRIQKEGPLKNGFRNGKWKLYNKNDTGFSLLTYNNGQPEGESIKYDENGNPKSSRFYLGSSLHWVDYNYYPNGSKKSEIERKLLPLRKVGSFKTYFQNGNIDTKGVYNEEGKRMGEWISYFENGNLKSINTYNDNGDEIGEWISYFENGTIKESINYNENGVGVKIHYNEVGEKLNGEIVTYKDDPSDWYNQGKPKVIDEINNYKDGILNGVSISYNYLGNRKSSERFYVNGKLEGKYILYGTKKENDEFVIYKKSESNYTNNKQNGVSIKYYENGYEKERTLWENGKFIKKL